MLSEKLFFVLVSMVALQRMIELWWSYRNEKKLLQRGGLIIAPHHFIVMKLIHASWLISMVVEQWYFHRPFFVMLALPMFIIFLIGQVLRLTALTTLKERWTASIVVLPNAHPIRHGIYRLFNHPNYIGVVLEIMSLPLIHSCYLSSIIFSLLNAWILKIRIGKEEQALRYYCHYEKV